MKKCLLIFLFGCLFLAGCERAATLTDWSPINDAGTPLPTALTGLPSSTSSTQAAEITSETRPASSATVDVAKLPDPLPESLKGYELVSWQEGEDWHFTLITATNRGKTFEELMSPESAMGEDGLVKITVRGVDQLKEVIERLPAQTQVFWSGMDLTGQVPVGTLYFSYPPEKIINDLAAHCARVKVDLIMLAEPE